MRPILRSCALCLALAGCDSAEPFALELPENTYVVFSVADLDGHPLRPSFAFRETPGGSSGSRPVEAQCLNTACDLWGFPGLSYGTINVVVAVTTSTGDPFCFHGDLQTQQVQVRAPIRQHLAFRLNPDWRVCE